MSPSLFIIYLGYLLRFGKTIGKANESRIKLTEDIFLNRVLFADDHLVIIQNVVIEGS